MALPAIENYSDEKLAELRDAVLNELEVRERRERIPAELSARARTYLAEGGDESTLRTALDEACTPEPVQIGEPGP